MIQNLSIFSMEAPAAKNLEPVFDFETLLSMALPKESGTVFLFDEVSAARAPGPPQGGRLQTAGISVTGSWPRSLTPPTLAPSPATTAEAGGVGPR